MDLQQINQLLTVYIWFPLAGLLGLMLLVARFYQKQTGERTYYPYFAVPMVLFGVAAAQYASSSQVIGLPLPDLLFFLSGVVLIFLCIILYRQMMKNR